MFEAMIIVSFIYAARFGKLKGKTYEELTFEEQDIVIKALKKDYWRRNKYTPEEYLPRVQKNASMYLAMGIILSILYVPLVIILLSTM